jgi:DNA-binding transcriptional LysR family regulator
VSDERMDVVHLFEDPYVVMSPWEPTPDPRIDLYTLHGAPMIGDINTSCTIRVQRHLHDLGVVPNYVFRTNDNTALQAMVRAGMGHCVSPLLAIDISDPNILVRAATPTLPSRLLGIAWMSGRTVSPSTERFAQIIRDVCAELVAKRRMPEGIVAA